MRPGRQQEEYAYERKLRNLGHERNMFWLRKWWAKRWAYNHG